MSRCLIGTAAFPRLRWARVPARKGDGAMQLTVTGKQIEVGDALRRHIENSLGSILDKYFKTAIEAHVVVAKEAI